MKNNHRRGIAKKNGRVTLFEWQQILIKSGGACFYCKDTGILLTQDHFIPLSKGGPHSALNIVAACGPCNNKKNAMLPQKFMERMGFI